MSALDSSLAGKRVLITGASSGIGRETALLAARSGAEVVAVARNAERLGVLVEEICGGGGSASWIDADLADPEAVERMARRALTEAPAPDLLLNLAGAGRWRSFLETTPQEARAMMDAPYHAAFATTRAFLPAMQERGGGRIGFLTSPASHMVWPGACGYIAARHALKGLAEALRVELRDTPVGVSLITLGTVESDYWRNNPGSRERVPSAPAWLAPPLSVAQAAETVLEACASGRARVTRPWFFSVLKHLGPP